MFNIQIKGLDTLKADVDDIIKRSLPKTIEVSINRVGKSLKENTVKQLSVVFDRPVKWTLNSVYFKPATAGNLNAWVWFKDDSAMDSSKGTPASKYLYPEVHGGPRNLKRLEKALQRFGVLPSGYYTVPGEGAKIDSHGNMDHRQIIEMLTGVRALQGMADTNFYGVRGGYKLRSSRTANFFVVKQKHGGLVPGIWERLPATGAGIRGHKGPKAVQKGQRQGKLYSVIQGRRVRPVLIFVKSPRYNVRFPFYDWAQNYVDVEFPKIFHQEIEKDKAHYFRKTGGR